MIFAAVAMTTRAASTLRKNRLFILVAYRLRLLFSWHTRGKDQIARSDKWPLLPSGRAFRNSCSSASSVPSGSSLVFPNALSGAMEWPWANCIKWQYAFRNLHDASREYALNANRKAGATHGRPPAGMGRRWPAQWALPVHPSRPQCWPFIRKLHFNY
jgi:hypothetical protein